VSNVHCGAIPSQSGRIHGVAHQHSAFAGRTREFRDLEQTYTRLAENEEWMEVHTDKMIPPRKNYDNRTTLAEEEEQILKCLGAAVLMRWNTVPTKLRRELFDCASSIGDLQQTTPLKGRIARFLHNHKNDQRKSD